MWCCVCWRTPTFYGSYESRLEQQKPSQNVWKFAKSLHKRGLAERDGLQTGKEVMELEVNCLYLRFLKLSYCNYCMLCMEVVCLFLWGSKFYTLRGTKSKSKSSFPKLKDILYDVGIAGADHMHAYNVQWNYIVTMHGWHGGVSMCGVLGYYHQTILIFLPNKHTRNTHMFEYRISQDEIVT